MKTTYRIVLPIVLLIFLMIFFKALILKSIGDFLIVENKFDQVDNAFVLSGSAYDRGNKAISLYQENKIKNIICLGSNWTPSLKALGLNILESELTQKHILKSIPDSSKVMLLPIGTSTLEESQAILNYCSKNKLKKIIIISSKFHTRRIDQVFTQKFKEKNIEVYISGASSSSYNESIWWKSENGLIALNNEYIKLIYYLFK